MSYSILYGKYFTVDEIIEMINKVERERRDACFGDRILDITFAEQLRNTVKGIKTPPAQNLYKNT